MKKIISFSLWGDKPLYVTGAIENVVLASKFYKGWTCRFYVDKSVPTKILNQIKEKGGEIIDLELNDQEHNPIEYATNGINPGWFWRFEILNDKEVDRFIVRDVDSRLSMREKNCVIDWEMSKKPFHIIRDHPMHGVPILAGTWGATKEFASSINYTELKENFLKMNSTNNAVYGGYDQFFLGTVIYPMIKDTACVHDDYFNFEPHKKKIPHLKVDEHFIGEVYEVN